MSIYNTSDTGAEQGASPRLAGQTSFVRRVLIVFGIALGIALIVWLVWIAFDVLLLIFAGLLLAVLLRGTSDRLSHATRLSAGWSLTIVLLGSVALVIFASIQLAPGLATQMEQLLTTLPTAIQQLQSLVAQYDWIGQVIGQMMQSFNLSTILTRATGVFSTTFGALLQFFIVVLVGLYFAVDPRLYTHGLLRLVPMQQRARAQVILSELGDTLWWWLLSRLLSMAAVGVMTGVGLWILGVPLPFTLGVLAALLDFIPNIGPWLAGIPGVLLALLQSPEQALYTVLLYLVIQQIEGYLITPIVQQRAINLPPVTTLFAQVLLTLTVGGVGLILASPLAAVAQVLVRMVYVEDVLGDREDATEQKNAVQHQDAEASA